MCVVLGCSPPAEDTDDVYPRNCGVEGPVDLFEYPADTLVPDTPQKVGDHYLVGFFPDEDTLELVAVDRCGTMQVPVPQIHDGTSVHAVGRWLLECDPADPRVWAHDVEGVSPPRVLFDSAVGCRVLAVGDGVAAQEAESGRVWFHPDPSDPQRDPVLVTDVAKPGNDDVCIGELDCDLPTWLLGLDIQAAGDELFFVEEDGKLSSFSAKSENTKVLYEGTVRRTYLLPGKRYLAVSPAEGETFVLDLEERSTFEFCCLGDVETVRVLRE